MTSEQQRALVDAYDSWMQIQQLKERWRKMRDEAVAALPWWRRALHLLRGSGRNRPTLGRNRPTRLLPDGLAHSPRLTG